MSGWDWIASHLTDIAAATRDHVVLTIIAVGVGFAISFALALLIHRDRRAYAPVTAVSGLLYAIPSLALFAILVPITGLSVLTAEIGLVSYTLLILVRNIVAGLGQLMLRGFTLQNYTAVYVGTALSVALAVAADLLFLGALRLATPWRRARER